MPTSSYKKIGRVLGVLEYIKEPCRVLDIGAGFGKYGLLLREHLDVRKGRYAKDEWTTQIDCIEIWGEYITPVHKYIYNHVYLGDVRNLLPSLGQYDLIVLSDVIEHMPREDGTHLLKELAAKATDGMVVSYPNVIGTNWKSWPNPYERHHVVWTVDDFQRLFECVVPNSTQVVYILNKEK